VLGLYEEALAIDARPEGLRPALSPGRARERRQIWCLFQLDRGAEAKELAESWLATQPADAVLQSLTSAARRFASEQDRSERRRMAARMTPLTRMEGGQIKGVERRAPARPVRSAPSRSESAGNGVRSLR